MEKPLKYWVTLLFACLPLLAWAQKKEEKPFDFRVMGGHVGPYVMPLSERKQFEIIKKPEEAKWDHKFLPAAKWTDGNKEFQLGISHRKIIIRANF